MLRKQLQQDIIRLLREHDALSYDDLHNRNAIKRRILFLMESVKLDEHTYA